MIIFCIAFVYMYIFTLMAIVIRRQKKRLKALEKIATASGAEAQQLAWVEYYKAHGRPDHAEVCEVHASQE
jgi:hypothetical protein